MNELTLLINSIYLETFESTECKNKVQNQFLDD